MSDSASSQRLASLDLLRGFDLIWILGAEKIWLAMFLLTGWSGFQSLAGQFEHAAWIGFHAYDLIFPLFIFISGVTIGLSGKKMRNISSQMRPLLWRKAIRRLLLLIVLGILYNHAWGQGIPLDVDSIRFASVLARIGFCWFVAVIAYWYLPIVAFPWLAFAILLLYACLHLMIPLPGEVTVLPLTMEANWNAWVDQHWLPGLRWKNLPSDPEGLLSQFPALANVFAGVVAGHWIAQHRQRPRQACWRLLMVGLGACFLALALGQMLPIIKHLWTSSFALLTIGLSFCLLAFFYWLFDVNARAMKLRQKFHWLSAIGANAILFYLMSSLFDWDYVTKSLVGGFTSWSPGWYQLLACLLMVGLQAVLASWLWRNKIMVKI